MNGLKMEEDSKLVVCCGNTKKGQRTNVKTKLFL